MKTAALTLLCAGISAAATVAVVTPHGDDWVLYAGATLAGRAERGDAIYLIRVTNDEKHSAGLSLEETRLRTRTETEEAAKILGVREVIHLNFKDGELEPVSETELRTRLIHVFRTIKPDTVFTADPWARYDDNFDHQKVGRTVEDACWTGGNNKFHPEMNRSGLATHSVRDRYYWTAGKHWVNHRENIGTQSEKKRRALQAIGTFAGFRAHRFTGRDSGEETFHYWRNSGLQTPYADWFAGQKTSGREWGAPEGKAIRADPQRVSRKTVVIVSPHADDFTLSSGGAIATLIQAGHTAIVIRGTNDEKDSYDLSTAETILRNAQEVETAARILGVKDVISLNFKNDELDPVSHTEIRGRLILLFRLLKPDVLMTFDPWSLYEENPDHVKFARAAAEAAWAAGSPHFNPEHLAVGLKPHAIREKYYWARGPSDVNRFFDITPMFAMKMKASLAHKTMMRATALHLKDKLAVAGLRLPALDDESEASVNRLIETLYRERAESIGKLHGVKLAEQYHFAVEP